MLFLVEVITAILSVSASVAFSGVNDELVRAAKLYFAGFLLLLVFSHVAAYALLRYLPTLKETIAWAAIAGAITIEIAKDA